MRRFFRWLTQKINHANHDWKYIEFDFRVCKICQVEQGYSEDLKGWRLFEYLAITHHDNSHWYKKMDRRNNFRWS